MTRYYVMMGNIMAAKKDSTIEKKAQIKSKKRVAERGEVFTNEREVKAMCDLVDCEIQRIERRFLEPTCGDGNFLAEILTRKLNAVKTKYKRNHTDFELYSVVAVSSLYGVDIMKDNVTSCRERLFKIWEKIYKSVCKTEYCTETVDAVKFILEHNILCGNALTLKQVDENQNDTENPIIFSEWTRPFNDYRFKRSDYIYEEMIDEGKEVSNKKKSKSAKIINNNRAFIPEEIKRNKRIVEYRKIQEA